MRRLEKDYTKIRAHVSRYHRLRAISRFWDKACRFAMKWFGWLSCLKFLNPFRYLNRLDRYIIAKFIGTYIYSILLIISIAVVFDFNENVDRFTTYHAPWKGIFYYYLNFIPYYANLNKMWHRL